MRFSDLRHFLLAACFVAVQATAGHAQEVSLCNGEPNGILDGDEQCETGPCCNSNCEQVDPSTVCRPATDDVCDIEETCGEQVFAVEAECPADTLADNDTPCDDGSACTIDDTCQEGTCTGGGAIVCDDENACTDDSCDPESGCLYVFNTDPCDDGSACTTDDACLEGDCMGVPVVCDDDNECTDDSCNPGSGDCEHANNSGPCEDGSACTSDDTCQDGACVGGDAVVCEDDNACTDDSCDPESGCVFENNTDACDDGSVCTENDACQNGACTGDPVIVCDDENGCTDDVCNPESGECEFANNSAPCDDGLFCTVDDVCADGVCTAGVPNSCGDGNVCTTDACNEDTDTCENENNTLECDDGDPCTSGDVCEGGVCAGIEDPTCGATTTTTLPDCPICGDFNEDCELTASDALQVLRAAVGLVECALEVCDFNGDGKTTALDALAVLRASVGLESDPRCLGTDTTTTTLEEGTTTTTLEDVTTTTLTEGTTTTTLEDPM